MRLPMNKVKRSVSSSELCRTPVITTLDEFVLLSMTTATYL